MYVIRYDEVQRDIDGIHQRIALHISSEQLISKSNLEELYIYLKEKVSFDSISRLQFNSFNFRRLHLELNLNQLQMIYMNVFIH